MAQRRRRVAVARPVLVTPLSSLWSCRLGPSCARPRTSRRMDGWLRGCLLLPLGLDGGFDSIRSTVPPSHFVPLMCSAARVQPSPSITGKTRRADAPGAGNMCVYNIHGSIVGMQPRIRHEMQGRLCSRRHGSCVGVRVRHSNLLVRLPPATHSDALQRRVAAVSAALGAQSICYISTPPNATPHHATKKEKAASSAKPKSLLRPQP